jgi:YWFCY protein/Type IV secretory system Conjugative DNA transfer
MVMQTGENEQGLRKILDLTRGISIVVLFLHFYYFCNPAFREWRLTAPIGDRLLENIGHTGLFDNFNKSKLMILGFLFISLIGARGRKKETLKYRTSFIYLFIGLLIYFSTRMVFNLNLPLVNGSILYMVITAIGYLLILTGGTIFTRIIKINSTNDIFNKYNESFPQEERLIENQYSINLPAQYYLKGKLRRSYVNIPNPFRGVLIIGSPGSGKSYFIIQHIIKQLIEKGFTLFVYDFKFDELTRITYNHFLKHKGAYKICPRFYTINFDKLSLSNRCNPLDASSIHDITDAGQSARTLLLALNRDWIKKEGDFWVESPINFITAIIYFLASYENGKYCSLPHVIEFSQTPYEKLFSILRTEPQVEALISPFINAFLNDAKQQLEGMIASATISLSKLSSPQLYFVLSGNDFTLDINNPLNPKIVCLGNNPQKAEVYGAAMSLFSTTVGRLTNQKGKLPCCKIYDEFTTLCLNTIDKEVATGRSNKVATVLAVQDASQLKLHYGKEQADVIINIAGNIITGQAKGEIAKTISEAIGKTMQERQSITINGNDTSLTRSRQLELAIPVSKIATLSSGEFVGIVADNPNQKIELKTFCAEIVNDHTTLEKELAASQDLPVLSKIKQQTVMDNYLKIKKEVQDIIATEIVRMMNTPELAGLIIKKD